LNVLVGADMIKTGFGWSDAELEENMRFHLLVRYALGLKKLNQDVPVLRTFKGSGHDCESFAVS
jgi:hypothetical protein